MRSDHLSKHVKTHSDVKKGESDSENSQDITNNKTSDVIKGSTSPDKSDLKVER